MIQPGDIVRLGQETPLHAVVIANSRHPDVKKGHLRVVPLCRTFAPGETVGRDVRTTDVAARWRLVHAPNGSVERALVEGR